MNAESVLQALDAESIARDTIDFIKVRSETGREAAGSLFLADLLRREGFEPIVDVIEPNRPNIYCRIEGHPPSSRSRGPALLFNGHTDTIPVGNSSPPARDGDWIIGRGAEDMKGGLVAMVHAASALRKAGIRLAGDLWLTGVIGHETPAGKKEGPRRLIERLRTGALHAEAIVIVEGPCAVWTASLGLMMFTITMRSDRGPIHTIKVPYEENPARWLGELLMEFGRLEQRFAAAGAHPLCGRDQLNVGIVHAGDYPNRLPTPITVTGTLRWTPGKSSGQMRAELQDICDRLAARSHLHFRIDIAEDGCREPFETPRTHPIVIALQGAAERASGRTAEVIGMGLSGDANLFAHEAGVAAVYYGPAHETAHSDNERVSVSQLRHCAAVYALTATSFCGIAR